MTNIKKSSMAIALGLSLGTSIAFAVPLEGLFTIDPTVFDGYYGVGDPTYRYASPGNAVSTYTSGSVFVMNFKDEVITDPVTGRLLPAKELFDRKSGADQSFARVLKPGSAGGILAGQHQNFVLTPDEVHSVPGVGTTCNGLPFTSNPGTQYCTSPAVASNILEPFPFFAGLTYVGTNPISYVTGASQGLPVFDYDPVTGELDVDLSSWSVMWNGTVFDQGPSGIYANLVDASFDPVTNRYSLSWANVIPVVFPGFQGYWHIEGTYSPVPIPAAVWLFGSGLLGLAGLARRNKQLG